MAHGERSRRLANNCGRDYWSRRGGNTGCNEYPTNGHTDPKSHKRLTRRMERRKQRQERHDA